MKILTIGILSFAIMATIGLIPSRTIEIKADAQEVQKLPELPKQLKRICSCESTGRPDLEPRQFDKNGVLRGVVNKNDTGACQINLQPENWGLKVKELGFDVFTERGNYLMAIWIYEHYGSKPWNWSRGCWAQDVNELSTGRGLRI